MERQDKQSLTDKRPAELLTLTCFVFISPLSHIKSERESLCVCVCVCVVSSVQEEQCLLPWCQASVLWAARLFQLRAQNRCRLFLSMCALTVCSAGFQAVEELLESLELEKSNYHMGLSRVSAVAHVT